MEYDHWAMPQGVRLLLGCLLGVAVLLTGCDGPLLHATLIDRLGTGRYANFHVTFYRFSPAQMQGFLAGVAPEQYAFDEIIEDGPIERLQFVYSPKNHRVSISRTGNDVEACQRMVTSTKGGGRGPIEDIIRVLKSNPDVARSWFERDLYRSVDASDPEYFQGFDRSLRRRLERQTGSSSDWHLVELELTYTIPQPGTPVYTAEAALLPLTSSGPDGQLVSTLLSLADREFAKLKDPKAGMTILQVE